MCDTFSGAFEIYMNMLCLIVIIWIALSIIFYVGRNPNKASNISFFSQQNHQPADFNREPLFRETTPLPIPGFYPAFTSTPNPTNYQDHTTHDVSEGANAGSCNAGRVTINPWLNFLRHFRTMHCGIRQKELFQRAAQVWQNMSDVEKEPYREQAENMQSMRDSGNETED